MRHAAYLLGALALSGCAALTGEERIAFDGAYYDARQASLGPEGREVVITVRPVSQGLTGAREAGRYEAVKYCVAQFGNSDIDWDIGPDAPAGALPVAGDVVTFRGTCTGG